MNRRRRHDDALKEIYMASNYHISRYRLKELIAGHRKKHQNPKIYKTSVRGTALI